MSKNVIKRGIIQVLLEALSFSQIAPAIHNRHHMFATKLRLSRRHSRTNVSVCFGETKTCKGSSVHKCKIKWIDTIREANDEKQTFVVQSPDVIVHLVQELRVQQVHSSKQHLRGQASC